MILQQPTIRVLDDTFTLDFHSDDALNTKLLKSGDEFSIKVEEPVNLIHIESTNVKAKSISFVLELTGLRKKSYNRTIPVIQLIVDKEASSEDSVSLPLLLIVALSLGLYILIIVSMKGNEENVFTTEEE